MVGCIHIFGLVTKCRARAKGGGMVDRLEYRVLYIEVVGVGV